MFVILHNERFPFRFSSLKPNKRNEWSTWKASLNINCVCMWVLCMLSGFVAIKRFKYIRGKCDSNDSDLLRILILCYVGYWSRWRYYCVQRARKRLLGSVGVWNYELNICMRETKVRVKKATVLQIGIAFLNNSVLSFSVITSRIVVYCTTNFAM